MATEKKIQGRMYRCEKLPADIGLPYVLRLLKALSNAEDMIAAIVAENRTDAELDAAFLAGISRFLHQMDVAEITALITELVEKSCKHNGDPCVVGVNPQELGELLEVFVFALRVNYADFFGASGPLGSLVGRFAKTVA